MNHYYYIDLDNYYVYSGSNVLRNKLDIQDAQRLEEAEHLLVSIRLAELYDKPVQVKTIKDVCKIHKYLFQDIYDWAGEFRKVNISKENKPFLPLQAFEKASLYMEQLIHNVTIADSKELLIHALAQLLDNLNYMHPFREGNGRTQREVIRSILRYKGFDAEINSPEDEEIYDLYMQGTIYSDLTLLRKLFEKIV